MATTTLLQRHAGEGETIAEASSASCIHCPMVKFLCVNANTIVNEETFFVHFHKVSVYR